MSDDPPSRRWNLSQDVWYHAAAGTAEGPLRRGELLRLLARGDLPRTTPVWRPGMDAWLPAREVEALAEMLPPPVDGSEVDAGRGTEGTGAEKGTASSDVAPPGLPDLPPSGPGGPREEGREITERASSGWTPVAAGLVLVLASGLAAWFLGGAPVAGEPGAAGAVSGDTAVAVSPEERIRAVARSHRAALSDSLGRLPAGDSLRDVLADRGLAWTRQTGFSGLRRLPDRTVVAHAELMGQALSTAPPELCADVARWQATSEEYWRFVEGLGPEGMDRLLEILRGGVMAELRDRSRWPVPDRAAVSEAFSMLADRLSEPARDSLRRVLSPDAAAGPPAACWAERTLYGGVPRLPDPWRAVLARAVVTG